MCLCWKLVTTCPILTSGLATATAAGADQCFMWELAAGAGHYMIGLAGFSAQTGRYQNTERTWLREQSRGDHLMVQSLNTLINSIHFAPCRQGFMSIHELFVTLSCLLPKTTKTLGNCPIPKRFTLSWWQVRHNDVFPRPLPPASNCFVLGTIRWPSYKWWCDITHHNASHITSVSRDTLVTSVLCNIRTCWTKNFIKPPSPASPIY